MAPVSRRSFLAGLIAAPVIAAVAPIAREAAHVYLFDPADYQWREYSATFRYVNPRKLGVITNIQPPEFHG